ncbi:MAG TPA: MoaD/ThiS family protein [Anaerolineaceae bacterium]|nr:MoaD/ThiS family protein [Anaerolineaceae bacterium]
MIRIILPTYLQRLANVGKEIEIDIEGTFTISCILDSLEKEYPMLKGTIRDHITGERRPYLRFFACGEDFSHWPVSETLPEKISSGEEVFRIVGAMSGG